MKGLFKKNFKRFISIFLVFILGLSDMQIISASAHIDSDDEYFIYGKGMQEDEEGLIDDLYDNISEIYDGWKPVPDELNVVIPTILKRFVKEKGIGIEPGEESRFAERCVRDFCGLLRALAGDNFDETKFVNIIRIVFISSILCIVYSAHYSLLTKHMIYILNYFSERSPMIDKLIQNDIDQWIFVLEQICPYTADELLPTAENLCDFDA